MTVETDLEQGAHPGGLLDRHITLGRAARDQLFVEARTAFAFSDEPVSDEQIEAIYDLVKFGPTSYNNNPLRITIVRSDEARARLLPHLAEVNRPKVSSAPLTAILAWDTGFHEHFETLVPIMPDVRSLFEGDQEKDAYRVREGTLSAHMQAGYFVLGVRAAGLAAGPMSGFDWAGVDREFFPDGRLRSFLLVNIGQPEPAQYERLPRLGYDQVVRFV